MKTLNLNFKFFFFFLLLISAAFFSLSSRTYLAKKQQSLSIEEVPYCLPNKSGLKYLSLGFNTLMSKIIWFNTLNYFGERFQDRKDFPWLSTMCELVTTLDPQARHYFEFCATALSWMAKDPQSSIKILDRAIESENTYWKYYYLRGFNYWYFFKKYDLAKQDLVKASKLENAPAFISSLASRLLNQEEGPNIAREFLEQVLNNTQDEKIRLALSIRLKESILSEGLFTIKKASEQYFKDFGKIPVSVEELLIKNYIKNLPNEPYGERYLVNQESGAVYTSSGRLGLKFNAKTFDTGILRKEFKDNSYGENINH